MRWLINQTLVIISHLWLQGFININKKPILHNFCIADVSRILDLIVYTSENHWPDFEHICCKQIQDTVRVDFRSATLISSVSQSVSSFFAKLCSCLCSNEPDLNLLSLINGSTSACYCKKYPRRISQDNRTSGLWSTFLATVLPYKIYAITRLSCFNTKLNM